MPNAECRMLNAECRTFSEDKGQSRESSFDVPLPSCRHWSVGGSPRGVRRGQVPVSTARSVPTCFGLILTYLWFRSCDGVPFGDSPGGGDYEAVVGWMERTGARRRRGDVKATRDRVRLCARCCRHSPGMFGNVPARADATACASLRPWRTAGRASRARVLRRTRGRRPLFWR